MFKEPSLAQLRYFVAVARSGNMTAAAADLHVTQATVSIAMTQLEQIYGIDLFVRVPRKGVRLTPAGRRLLVAAESILDDVQALPESIARGHGDLHGRLSVGLYGPIAPSRVPVIAGCMAERYPGVELTFLEGDLEPLLSMVRTGECELAVMYDFGVDEQFDVLTVERIPPHLLVAASHRLVEAGRSEASLHEVARDPFVLLTLRHARPHYLNYFKILGIVPWIRHMTPNYETLRSYVAAGQGYSILNQRLGLDQAYTGGRVVALDIREELPPVELCLVKLRGVGLSRKAAAFVDACSGALGWDVAVGDSTWRSATR
ncbi:LysR family transcriptional regulator [Rhodococcus sp. WS4]|nr:LysR family transcriptional regulator [Rhodococcus sp. WS4]